MVIDPTINGPGVNAVSAIDTANSKLDSDAYRKIAQELIKESEKGFNDSNQKKEQAQAYLLAADAMKKFADLVRQQAARLRENRIEKEEAVKAVEEAAGNNGLILEFPIPKNATPEQLERIADSLEGKAKENIRKADDLLQEAERIRNHADNLKRQAQKLNNKDMNFSEMQLKSIAAHNEGLNMVFKKLGIQRLDSEYKEHIEYAEKKAGDQARLGY